MTQPGVDEVADELYGQPPAVFTAARDARAAEARAAGQRELAARIKQLRRPTLSAWAVNLLSRHESATLAELVALAGELRDAQANLQRDALRELMRRRQQVLSGLVTDAGRLAAAAGHPLAEEAGRQVERTLTAALSDPGAAEQVLSGRLVTPLEYAGFGEALDWSAPAPAVSPRPATRDGTTPDANRVASPAARRAEGAGTTAGTTPGPAAAGPAPRAQTDRRARLKAELATAERDLVEADEEAAQALQAQERAEQDRQRAATRREELHRELAEVQEAHAAAEVAIRQSARRATVLERNRSAAQRRVERLRTQLAEL